jgi:hypothetical protein
MIQHAVKNHLELPHLPLPPRMTEDSIAVSPHRRFAVSVVPRQVRIQQVGP